MKELAPLIRVHFQHKFREANKVADFLAKEGCEGIAMDFLGEEGLQGHLRGLIRMD